MEQDIAKARNELLFDLAEDVLDEELNDRHSNANQHRQAILALKNENQSRNRKNLRQNINRPVTTEGIQCIEANVAIAWP